MFTLNLRIRVYDHQRLYRPIIHYSFHSELSNHTDYDLRIKWLETGFEARALVALSLHMQVMIRIIKLEYFHSCLTAYLKAYIKQQVRVV